MTAITYIVITEYLHNKKNNMRIYTYTQRSNTIFASLELWIAIASLHLFCCCCCQMHVQTHASTTIYLYNKLMSSFACEYEFYEK